MRAQGETGKARAGKLFHSFTSVSNVRFDHAGVSNVRFKLSAVFAWTAFTWTVIQTYASIASNMQLQVSCVRGGGGRGRVAAVTSIGSTSHLKNGQMANVLDKGCESGKSCA